MNDRNFIRAHNQYLTPPEDRPSRRIREEKEYDADEELLKELERKECQQPDETTE